MAAMSEMVERVARAMREASRPVVVTYGDACAPALPTGTHQEEQLTAEWLALARAAIEAMRDPTVEIVVAGHSAIEGMAGEWSVIAAEQAYRAMIDAAISQRPDDDEHAYHRVAHGAPEA